MAVSSKVVVCAADLVARRPLRTLGALQLALTMLVAAGAPEPPGFGTADERIAAAARAEGLVVLVAAQPTDDQK